MFGYTKNDSDGDYTFSLSMRISELESKERVRELQKSQSNDLIEEQHGK